MRLGVDGNGENRAETTNGAKPEVPAKESSDIKETATANRKVTKTIEIIQE